MIDTTTAVFRVMKGLSRPIRLMIGLFVFGVIIIDMVEKIWQRKIRK